ncbi:E3 ubiquitin-protein ligase RNF4 isoform X5 [Chrysemys picta bellii]|uniref:E3 ubiquitin-protein ligase RNF4 isoform X5 n=1 Tax=Chrysemys picta bellii TaxID=8478 RepID=UPI0032B156E5
MLSNQRAGRAMASPMIGRQGWAAPRRLRVEFLDRPLRRTQRKRRGGAINSRQTRKRNRLVASATEMASEAEPIELEESAGEEVVDLTCESSEPVVVDLTHNDSVVIVEENQRQRRNLGLRSQRQSDSCVLSSDDEDESRDNDVYVTNKVSGGLETLEDETASSRDPSDFENYFWGKPFNFFL